MKSPRLLTAVLLSFLASATFPPVYGSCGNDGGNPPEECEPPECCDGGVGANPINPYRGNLWRNVTDLRTFGAAPIEFTRTYNSRNLNFTSAFLDFGTDDGWQHNWNYQLRRLMTQTNGVNDVQICYPNGEVLLFKATDASGGQFVPQARSGHRLYSWSGSVTGFTLVKPDGSEYDFPRYASPVLTPKFRFRLAEARNGQGFQWNLTYDANFDKVRRITNNFGRWLEIERAPIGGSEVITKVKTDDAREVVFAYAPWAPTAG